MQGREGRATGRSHDTPEEEAVATRSGHVHENNANRDLRALYRPLAIEGMRGI